MTHSEVALVLSDQHVKTMRSALESIMEGSGCAALLVTGRTVSVGFVDTFKLLTAKFGFRELRVPDGFPDVSIGIDLEKAIVNMTGSGRVLLVDGAQSTVKLRSCDTGETVDISDRDYGAQVQELLPIYQLVTERDPGWTVPNAAFQQIISIICLGGKFTTISLGPGAFQFSTRTPYNHIQIDGVPGPGSAKGVAQATVYTRYLKFLSYLFGHSHSVSLYPHANHPIVFTGHFNPQVTITAILSLIRE
jgi:hypothetical protein